MPVQSLGYVGIRTKSLDDWASYAGNFLGMQLVDRSRSTLAFRMDDRKQRIMVSADAAAQNAFGWEVADAAALDALARRLGAAKIPVEAIPTAEADLRGVGAGIAFADPAGTRLEAFHGAESTQEPFPPGRPICGFRTGTLGMGQVVLNVRSVEDLRMCWASVSATTFSSPSRHSSSTPTHLIIAWP